jgi:hypothetical protein
VTTYSGAYITETYFTVEADDEEQAAQFIKEMGLEEYDNANLMYVEDIKEIK